MLEPKTDHSTRMSQIRQRDTAPECAIRRLLTDLGAHFRTNVQGLPGRPDIVNQTEKWAIMVHGCFWHGHECRHGRVESKTNTQAWRDKISLNKERDRHKRIELEYLGFSVDEVWECEINDTRKLRNRLSNFIRMARERLESFSLDEDQSVILRRVSLGGERHRVSRVKRIPKFDELKLADAFDLAWLRSIEPLHRARNGAGELTCVDLFSGCGGLSLGVREACEASGRYFRPLLAMDMNPEALAVYETNFHPDLIINEDLSQHIDGAIGSPHTHAETALLARLDRVDLLVAGPPCQGHSNLNNHSRRDDDRNDLYLRVARFAEIARPRWVFVENVATVVHDIRGSLSKTRESLERCGYSCTEETINLSLIGVPQLRRRHILVASLTGAINIQSLLECHKLPQPRSVGWAINDLANMESDRLVDSVRNLSQENQERIDWLFNNNQYDLPNKMRPKCHHGSHTYYAMYGRLRPDRPTNTITTGFGCPGQGRYIHPTRPRTLTAHEAARLQMFPDFFDFSTVTTYKALSGMIGNAVPMKLSYLLTLAALRQ